MFITDEEKKQKRAILKKGEVLCRQFWENQFTVIHCIY